MINGVHGVIYSRNAEALRTFLRDTLAFPSIDAGEGWLLFGLPPAELGIHPADEVNHHELWLMCDDLRETVRQLKAKGVDCSSINKEDYGLSATIKLPGGDELGVFQPNHPTALQLTRKKPPARTVTPGRRRSK